MKTGRDDEFSGGGTLDPDTYEVPPEVLAAVMAGRTVEAVKLLREDTGLSLREAKRVVDMLERSHGGTRIPDAPQFTEVGGSRALIFILAAIVLGYLAFRFLGGG